MPSGRRKASRAWGHDPFRARARHNCARRSRAGAPGSSCACRPPVRRARAPDRPQNPKPVRGDSSELNPSVAKRRLRCGGGTVQIDSPASFFDHDRVKTMRGGIFGRIADTIIEGEASANHLAELALAQITEEARGCPVIVLEKSGIGIDLLAETLADGELGMGNVEALVEPGTLGFPDAVIRPQRLLAIGHGYFGEGGFSRMARGKGGMAFRMPVLGEHDMAEVAR